MSNERNFVLLTKSKQIERVQFVCTLLKRRISFDIVAKTASFGNNVKATFDFVERTKFYHKLI